jgi:hypothetical protein
MKLIGLTALCALVVACVTTLEDGEKTPDDASTATPATAAPTVTPTVAATVEPTASASAPTFGKICTKMGCVGALTVAVDGGAKLAKGKYVVEVEADGKKGKCSFVAPGFCGDKAPRCEGEVQLDLVTAGCDKASEKGAPPPALTELKLPTSPKSATVVVTRDGKKVGEAKLTPDYKENRPNGPDCDPVCKVAEARIEVK